jgi:hypothetical protein
MVTVGLRDHVDAHRRQRRDDRQRPGQGHVVYSPRLGVDIQVVDVRGGPGPVDLVDHVLGIEGFDVVSTAAGNPAIVVIAEDGAQSSDAETGHQNYDQDHQGDPYFFHRVGNWNLGHPITSR